MAIRDTAFTTGTPCWIDLGTSNIEASKDFYAGLFGWRAEDQGEAFGHYHSFFHGDHQVAGLMATPDEADGWTVYVAAADAEATQVRIEATGGQIISPAMEVGPLGTMLIAADPAGAGFGVWQGKAHIGFTEWMTAGTPCWFENYSREYAAVKDFYADVFGWEYDMLSDSDEFRYAQCKVDGEIVCGLMDSASSLPDGVASHWNVYIGVEDSDAAVARVTELGGRVLQEPFDSPYGRLALIADTNGAELLVTTVMRP